MLYYETLGFTNNKPTDEDIKKAYLRLAKKYHPDKDPNNPNAESMFKKIGAAYAYLTDPDKRNKYDRFINRGYKHVANTEGEFVAAPVFEKPLQQPHRARPHASSRRQQGRPAESHARSEYPQAQAPSSSSSNQQPETIFECLKPTRGNLHNKHRIPSLAKFIKNKEYLTKDENGNTALHFIIKKLYDEKIDLDICFSMINILITLLSSDESSISDDDLTAYLNEKDKDGNGPLDLLLQAQDLPHINSGDLTRLIARCKGLGATAHKLNENDTPNKESSLINKANEELTRIRNSGCGFFMSAEKHKAKVEALEKALASGNKAEISDALKMHRGIIPCHIFDAESTNAYKR